MKKVLPSMRIIQVVGELPGNECVRLQGRQLRYWSVLCVTKTIITIDDYAARKCVLVAFLIQSDAGNIWALYPRQSAFD